MPADKISLEHAKENKLFYVVANVVVYRPEDGRCLILKRSGREKVHPGKYCVPGGKLEWGDLDLDHPTRMNGEVLDFEGTLEKLLVRETKEESGVDIDDADFRYINSNTFVRPDGIPVTLVKFGARYRGGGVVLEENDFDDFAWVNGEEIDNYDCIGGIQDEVRKTIDLFKS